MVNKKNVITFLIVFIIMMLVGYPITYYSYCTDHLFWPFQFFYKIYAVKPLPCEYKQALLIVKQIPPNDTSSVLSIYTFFRTHYVKQYLDREPPFYVIHVQKNKYGSFKFSTKDEPVFHFLVDTAREPVIQVIKTKSGDCDDYSTALFAVYHDLGYKPKLILMILKNEVTGHYVIHEILEVCQDKNTCYLIDTVNDFVIVGPNSTATLMKYYAQNIGYYKIIIYRVFS